MPRKACGPHSARWAINAIGLTYKEDDGLEHKSVSPSSMLKIFVAHGFSPRFIQMYGDKVQLLRGVNLLLKTHRPVVLFVRGRLFPHWVVLCGRNKDMYCLYDPSVLADSDTTLPVGNRAVSGEKLLQIWSLKPWSYLIPSWQYIAITV
ncbi:MAG: hypothetical protein PHH40_00970 [Candidatus Moranbacteria bacterium]|nr:hypothetical protein [Candidatus Moranbacteria bacterium]MDD3964886.1 hypothetical protein [Candidatus Moranbacteria bacterium]